LKVTIFGVGYVGLVQAAVFANVGHDVVCIDTNAEHIKNLKKGIISIHEPGLESLVIHNYNEGRLKFTTDAAFAVEHGEFQFIAVGTPSDEDGSADLQYVLNVATTIAQNMTEPKIIIDKSTVPVGTGDKVKLTVQKILDERSLDLEFHVVSNPEFLKEGEAVADCKKPDRIVIGTSNSDVEKKMRSLLSPFNRNHDRIIIMDIRSAELTKYVANCMLATKISFMNEMSNIADKVGADIEAVRHGIGSDSRIGYQFIYPGCGYGGSCFPKDIKALIQTADSLDYDAQILKSVENVNTLQKNIIFNKILKHYNGNLKGKIFALWGLSFKPNTDDMREAPSCSLMQALWDAGAIVQAFDPQAMNECQRIFGQRDDLFLVDNEEFALKNADALIVVTEWQQFKAPDFKVIKKMLIQPTIFDGRNIYDRDELAEYGFSYYSIGR